MKVNELLGNEASIKGTMINAHLAWAKKEIPDLGNLKSQLSSETLVLLNRMILATEWIPLRCLIQIDRAIAATVGGVPEEIFRELGRYSAFINLSGVYKQFIMGEPHRYFERMAILHEQYQNFGRSVYEKVGERAGRIKIDHYREYSPVYCASAIGYFEESLRLMKAPGPIIVREKTCQCWGESMCLFEILW
jgi:hypothetical protein